MGFQTTLAGGPGMTVKGRSYSGVAVTVDRALDIDVAELRAGGWVGLADHAGTTAQRPVLDERNNAITSGFRYLDTTLGKVVIYSRAVGSTPRRERRVKVVAVDRWPQYRFKAVGAVWGRDMDAIAMAARLVESMKPRNVGTQVNDHVVRARTVPQPDYDAMQRLLTTNPKPRTANAA